jgi:serine/threonine protein kinase
MLPSDDAPNLPNVRLDDRYELLERIGAGGFGEVFRARQTSTGQIVAVKLLAPRVVGPDW